MTEATIEKSDVLHLTSEIVSAHVANNAVPSSELPSVIEAVFQTLSVLALDAPEEEVEELKPAVPIKKSVTPDHIICLEDGKKLKMLKRHLKTAYNMTPEDYRERWSLPSDYPMVAPNYAAKRQELAKKIGLGRNRTARAAS